jgi:YgiT-type zinc finger domain-containing protein
MEKQITSQNTGWGNYKVTVDNINTYVCPKCGEVIFEGKVAIMMQKLSRNLTCTHKK